VDLFVSGRYQPAANEPNNLAESPPSIFIIVTVEARPYGIHRGRILDQVLRRKMKMEYPEGKRNFIEIG
jgi:hypothetical protein